MAPKSKPKARAFNSINSVKKPLPDTSNPPNPFRRAPEHLEPFLSQLSPSHVYITHIDSKPRDFKQKIFAVPLLMNIGIICAIIWRIKYVGPTYAKIFAPTLMGQGKDATEPQLSTKEFWTEIGRRAVSFITDLLVYMYAVPWPRNFFAGQIIGNPVAWRWGVGFRDKEIIVRRSKQWDALIEDVFVEDGPGQQLLLPKVWRAVDPGWMSAKTGYQMLNNDWDLDFKSILRATKLVDKKELHMDDFRTTIYLHNKQFGWLELQTVAGGSAQEEEGRRKIVAFKDELTRMGKENLFFKWIELVQFESAKPDGFGQEQQAKTMTKARAMFESQGVDFDAFWKKIGGMEGLPGMDQM